MAAVQMGDPVLYFCGSIADSRGNGSLYSAVYTQYTQDTFSSDEAKPERYYQLHQQEQQTGKEIWWLP
jgi:hypothetical protein